MSTTDTSAGAKNDGRFAHTLGEEYELLLKSMPHYSEVQWRIGQIIGKRFEGKPVSKVKVLEIGCGTGITTRAILGCDVRTEIWAVDNEKVMLEQARAMVKGLRAQSRVHFEQHDILVFLGTVPDSYFDVVASAWVLHNFENGLREEIMKEIYRVLKPGGLFVNGDKYAHDDLAERASRLAEQIRRFDVYDGMGRSDYKAEWIAHYVQDERPEVIWIEGEAKKQMHRLGFEMVGPIYRCLMEAVMVGTKPV
ncbi:MAG TPA: class I SAM-dependent methyltransferase [Candidatus Paceibacterota bacterium]